MKEINKRIKDLKVEVTRNVAAFSPETKYKNPLKEKAKNELLWSIDTTNHVTEFLGNTSRSNIKYGTSKVVIGCDLSSGEDTTCVTLGFAFDSLELSKTCIKFFCALGDGADEFMSILRDIHGYNMSLDGYILPAKVLHSIYTKNIEYPDFLSDIFHEIKVLISEHEMIENTYGDCYDVIKLNSDIAKFENTLILKNDIDDCRILIAVDVKDDPEKIKTNAIGARVEVVGKDGYHYLVNKSNYYRDSRGEKRKINPYVTSHEAYIVKNIFKRFGIGDGPANTKDLLNALTINVEYDVCMYEDQYYASGYEVMFGELGVQEFNKENSIKIIMHSLGRYY